MSFSSLFYRSMLSGPFLQAKYWLMCWMLNSTIDDTNGNESKFSQKDLINFYLTRSIQSLQVNCIITSNLRKYGFHSINSDNVLLEQEKNWEKKWKKHSDNCQILWNIDCIVLTWETYNQLNATTAPILDTFQIYQRFVERRDIFSTFVHFYRWAYSSHGGTI